MKSIFLAAVLWGMVSSPAHAEVRILASPGGVVGPFIDLFERVRSSGERVVIDGPCLSACTLVLSMVPDDRICVTRRAVLGFHAARSIDRRGRIYAEPEASRIVLQAYDKKNLIFDRAIDHPGDAELVDAHAESLGEEGLRKRHGDVAALGQRLEPALGIHGILDLQRD
jgi:hypothetical protein